MDGNRVMGLNWNDLQAVIQLATDMANDTSPRMEMLVVKYPDRANYNIVQHSNLERCTDAGASVIFTTGGADEGRVQ